ncbi:hypothetical protein HYDPIDRAFT_83919, partial [Hydnomerulius pinastri MD-312]
FPEIKTMEDKRRIIEQWQREMGPKNALANFQYYGRERLDPAAQEAFNTSSPFDLILVSRARASTITFHYNTRSGRGGYAPEETAQRYNRGNVAIIPQEPGELRKVLPPRADDIRDTVCVLFTGGRRRPTAEMLKKFKPVLVRKSRVKAMIEFLVANNEWYRTSEIAYSEDTMADLFGPDASDEDEGILKHMEIHHLSDSGSAISQDEHGEADEDDLLKDCVMDNVAYTQGDFSPRSRESMKAHALAYALDRKRFLTSRAGSQYLGDGDPGLMSYLFPHLDPGLKSNISVLNVFAGKSGPENPRDLWALHY